MSSPTVTWILSIAALFHLSTVPSAAARWTAPVGQEPVVERNTCDSLDAGFPMSAAWPYHDGEEGPKELSPKVVDYFRLPRTWVEALDQARLIAHVRIRERAYEVRVDPNRGHEYVISRYTSDVIEFLKPAPSETPGARTLEILRYGGVMVRDGGAVIHYDFGFADYLPGCEYVVFLDWDPGVDGYHPLGGPYFTFLLDTRAQRVISRSRLLRDQDAVETPLTFLSLLRTLVRSVR